MSPDGRQIALTEFQGGDPDIYIVNSDWNCWLSPANPAVSAVRSGRPTDNTLCFGSAQHRGEICGICG
jgi:hypothetical protein